MDFLGEQALAANFRQLAVEHLIARGADLVFLERPHVAQDRAETGQYRQKGPRLHQRERRRTRSNPERQLPPVGFGLCGFLSLAGSGLGRDLL
ncbi:hypothetical protein JCM25156A_20300 [Komagataeibacter kakiaceti JCM 25156]